MLDVRRFRISDVELWTAVIFEEKIDGIVFSLDGRDFLEKRIHELTSFLTARGVDVEVQRVGTNSPFPEMVVETLTGKTENAALLKELSFNGVTPFERMVYEFLTKRIKRGNVITYGELAKALGTSPRAIGGAMRRNPYPPVVPCHRVISADGIGYYTPKIDYKLFLLEIEGVKKWIS
ncbi:methylated-DNA--protein-cysteine methyltransferase [Thermococcus sp.]|uniref:methylated-DNA--protein-cysteine methyltransferase n=1 Tax=Thermococcus sp. TaxID=35749 RepID=UPI0026098652|nr:methylated-DNA--protein-cysteine methyltransferase [Thermococcus sp.]